MPDTLRILPHETLNETIIKARLMAQFDSELDPISQGIMLCGAASYGKLKRDGILADPTRYPYCPVVYITSTCITLNQEYLDRFNCWSAVRFVLWLVGSYGCEIRDGYGNDWTERYRTGGFAVFYEAPLFASAASVTKPALVTTLVLSLQRLPPNYVLVDEEHPELGYLTGLGPDDYIEDEAVAAVSLDFDAIAMRERLLQQFDSLADPCGSSTVLLAGLPTAVAALRDARAANPQQWPNCPRIELSAATIRIEQQHGDVHQIMSCIRFLDWVMEQVGDDRVCRIEDGNGIDLTAQWSTPDRLATFYDSRLWL